MERFHIFIAEYDEIRVAQDFGTGLKSGEWRRNECFSLSQ